MPNDGGGTPHNLVVQSWAMYSIAILLFIARVYVRVRRVGLLHCQVEDYLMAIAVAWYTAFVVTNISLANGGGGSLYLPGQYVTFTPENIKSRIKFSKIEFASEQCMLLSVYTLKACMLLMYYRITSNSKQEMTVKICGGYAACGFIASELVLFLNCHPFHGYWTLPPPQEECATYFRYLIVQAVFNISSDIAILCVIIPVLWNLQMSRQNKLPLVFIFSLGFFLVICALVSKIFTFRDVYDTSYQFWYLREASVGVYISNLPYIWGFLRQLIPALRAVTSTQDRDRSSRSRIRRPSGASALSPNSTSNRMSKGREEYIHSGRSESEENIISLHTAAGDVPLSDLRPAESRYIIKTTEIHLSCE